MLELEHRFRVVDVHARLSTDEGGVSTRGRAIGPENLERELHQAGVVKAVVYPDAGEGAYLRANNAVARMSVERPFVAFARLTGTLDAEANIGARFRNLAARRKDWHTSPEDVERYAYDDRFEGFVVDPTADGLLDGEVVAQLADVSLPVLVRGGVSFPPAAVAEAFLDWDIPLILAHFGGHPLDRALMDEAISLLDSHDTLYLDTSFVRYRGLLERAIREHPDRVLFGSGAPDTHPNVSVMEILTLDVPEDAMARVFSKNPSRVVPALAP
ncbi:MULTISPECIES: amidohydrolase family protein [unclassified Haladaptatus]|uniref:amidohydrolase family protein n=1 Tax=unclassified Haladaptatus TaxID=2622732 RepID=UPI0023E8097B|nr:MULTISPECIES: amidohydrolase family protein [unclassified Haladaptatus]